MIGQSIGHYKVLEKLGAGGMGEVYRAEDTALKRQVAPKVLPADLASSQERLERFQREAKTPQLRKGNSYPAGLRISEAEDRRDRDRIDELRKVGPEVDLEPLEGRSQA